MISIVEQLFEIKAISPTADRIEYANNMIYNVKNALSRGRIAQKEAQNKLKYYQKLKSGTAGTPNEVQSGMAAGKDEIKKAGLWF